jgi:hypothetical protein
MHRLLSRFVTKPLEERRVEAVRPRGASSVSRPATAPKRSLNEAAHKPRR